MLDGQVSARDKLTAARKTMYQCKAEELFSAQHIVHLPGILLLYSP